MANEEHNTDAETSDLTEKYREEIRKERSIEIAKNMLSVYIHPLLIKKVTGLQESDFLVDEDDDAHRKMTDEEERASREKIHEEIVLNMLSANMDMSFIMKVTSLKESEILEIKKNHDKKEMHYDEEEERLEQLIRRNRMFIYDRKAEFIAAYEDGYLEGLSQSYLMRGLTVIQVSQITGWPEETIMRIKEELIGKLNLKSVVPWF